MALRPATIEIVIDELVLDGVEPGDPRVARTVEEAIPRQAREALGPELLPGAVGAAVDSAVGRQVSA